MTDTRICAACGSPIYVSEPYDIVGDTDRGELRSVGHIHARETCRREHWRQQGLTMARLTNVCVNPACLLLGCAKAAGAQSAGCDRPPCWHVIDAANAQRDKDSEG